MKLLIFAITALCTLNSCAQTTMPQGYIKGKKFEGYIFPQDYASALVKFEGATARYTPTEADIIKAEGIIETQLASINNALTNQGGSCPVIHNNLPKYRRQYVGYIDGNGDKIVWVNYIIAKDKAQLSRLNTDIIVIFDGCSNYWNIKVNLTKTKLYDLQVNGSA